MSEAGRCVVIGVGNEYRRDDGFGLAVVARLADRRRADPGLTAVALATSDGEPARLLDLWTGTDLAVVVDAVRDGNDHGGHRYELVLDELATGGERSAGSSHGIGLGSTVELGRVLGRLPRRLVVLAVGAVDFGFGLGLTPEVAAEVEPVADRVRELVG